MFLKRLEIIGFKSFADRIGIDFVPGVTAVVGPNGSGKSNVADAIRWVLGEQSAKSLRGSKMEDVIFSGSDSRKPLNFAEVTLILDNTQGLFPLDYTEISVSRRVFRSGESVYLLNGQQCRLKDINDVFIDSGLGKEAFSIISQGRVDEILNSRPEDRRSIFDEAAGVLKYKTRKRKAEHKLFETADNLDRVLDILKELDSRIEPLSLRAKAAERHAVLLAESEEADILLLNYDAHKIHAELQVKSVEVTRFQKEKNEIEQSTTDMEQQLASDKDQLAVVDQALESLQQKLVDASAKTEKWEGRRLLSVEKERNVDLQNERIQIELVSIEEEQAERALKLVEANEKLNTLTKSYEVVTKEIAGITQILKRSVKETESEIEELKSTYIDGLNEEATIRNELKHMAERVDGEKSSSEKILKRTVILNEQLQELEKKKQTTEETVNKIKKALRESEKDYEENAKILCAVEKDLKNKDEHLQKAHNKQHEMQGRIRVLESMASDFSGFNSGVKEVLVARKSGALKEVVGAVAELITVENTYIKAVETALGGAMQHIVTSTEQAARNAIGHLKKKNAGRATFLPLDVMRSRKIQQSVYRSIEKHPEFIGTADELVKTDPSYKIITENLLGNVLIASTLAGASEIAKILNYRFRIVTIEGDVVNAGGSLTGGGATRHASVFSRKAELEKLKVQQKELTASIKTGESVSGETKMQVAKYMQQTEEARKQIETLQLELATGESLARETVVKLEAVKTDIASIELGRRGSETENSAFLIKKEQLEGTHESLKRQLQQMKIEIETLERFAADWRTEERKLTEQLTDLREKSAVLREQRAHQKITIEDFQRAELFSVNKKESLKEELRYLSVGDPRTQLSSEEVTEKITQAVAEKEQLQQNIQTSREQRAERMSLMNDKEEELRQLRLKTEEASNHHHRATVAYSRLEVTYETALTTLLDEYGLRPDSDFTFSELFNESETRSRLVRIKEELALLGPVNPVSIDEYKEVSERHEFLTAQRTDLLEAKSTLQEAMTEMDEEMTARFSATFHAIQNRFRHVFKEMFGGGNADLILTDPTNLLETGVEIMARPPGKKLQNLSLLSGGERSLTAITLLFSIIEVRPVPFCILDEVEAALDEANVLRYSNYLKSFSKHTQFIVITHRKGTMEGADVLYGITMQESGVSKLISVKLSEVPEEALV